MKKIAYLLLVVCTSCFNTLTGHRGVSNNINESKKRNVFIEELFAPSNPYIINDTLKINIRTAWLEKKWAYDTNPNETILSENYQLIIESDKSVKGIKRTWQIGNSLVESFRSCGNKSIMTDIKDLPTSDSLIWNITLGRRYDSSKKIGKFILIVKNRNLLNKNT